MFVGDLAEISFQNFEDLVFHLLLGTSHREEPRYLLTLMVSVGSRGGTLGFWAAMISSSLSGVSAPSLLAALSFCACESDGEQDCDSM